MSDSVSKFDKPKRIFKTGLKVGNKIHLAFAELGNRLAKYNIDMSKLKSNQSQTGDLNNENRRSGVDINSNLLQNSEPPFQTSREIYEDVLRKLQKLGDKGKRVLDKLNKGNFNETSLSNTNSSEVKKPTDPNKTERRTKHKLRHHRKALKQNKKSNDTEIDLLEIRQRERREILLNSLKDPLTQHDEEAYVAMEEVR